MNTERQSPPSTRLGTFVSGSVPQTGAAVSVVGVGEGVGLGTPSFEDVHIRARKGGVD